MCRIGFIRLCQKMGFELKEIKTIIDLETIELKTKLDEQTNIIRRKIDDLRYLLNVTASLVTTEEDPRSSEKIFEIFNEDRF